MCCLANQLTFNNVGGALLVGVVGGDASLESDSLGNRRFFGGATISEIGGESVTKKNKNTSKK